MKALVACEYSGIVRDAFENVWWDTWSCDLLPTKSEQTRKAGKHIQADILRVLEHLRIYDETVPFVDDVGHIFYLPKMDLMIAFPPCTYSSYAYTGERRYEPERLLKTADAITFFIKLWNAKIKHICLENPVGVIQHVLPYSQIVQPYFWGKETNEDYTKRTCLWLKNLPKLRYEKEDNLFAKQTYIKPTRVFCNAGGAKGRSNSVLSGFANGNERSKFHKGIAKAMAEQWTEYILNKQTI